MKRQQGFTLVELSIVLAIIALLVGGIIAGQGMIRSAEIKGVLRDLASYKASYDGFQARFKAIPGDMLTATKYWTEISSVCPSGGGPGTCNGNGDGMIMDNEQFRAWQHLSSAGFIAGAFSGVNGAGGTNHHVINANCPKGSIENTGFAMSYKDTVFGVTKSNVLFFGTQSQTTYPTHPALTPEEAYGIDVKADDGRPGMGRVQQFGAAARANCASNDDPTTATYVLSYKSKACPLIYSLQ